MSEADIVMSPIEEVQLEEAEGAEEVDEAEEVEVGTIISHQRLIIFLNDTEIILMTAVVMKKKMRNLFQKMEMGTLKANQISYLVKSMSKRKL
jgi:hypothetical protein